ncbi:hypothetical protein TNCV_2987801, partial [Trichonephila clavipes]
MPVQLGRGPRYVAAGEAASLQCWSTLRRRITFDILGPLPRTASEPTRLGPESSSLSASVPHTPFTRLPDIHHPRCFLAEIFISLVTCCLVALRIHPSSPEEYVRSQARFEECTQFMTQEQRCG